MVTATNCLGTGVAGRRWCDYTPDPERGELPAPRSRGHPERAEPVEHRAADRGGRELVQADVRPRVPGRRRCVPDTAVSGRLTASRPDGSAARWAAQHRVAEQHHRRFRQHARAARSSLATSLNFELPPEWLSDGQLHLQIDHLDIEGAQSTFPCIHCDNPGPAGPGPPSGPALVRFTRAAAADLADRRPYMAGTTQVMPRQLDFDMLSSWLRRAYPTADVQFTQTSLPPSPPAGDLRRRQRGLSRLRRAAAGQAARTRFYGLIPDNARSNFVGGCSTSAGSSVLERPARSSRTIHRRGTRTAATRTHTAPRDRSHVRPQAPGPLLRSGD